MKMSTETPNAPEVVTPLTFADIQKFSPAEMRAKMKDPAMAEQIEAAIASRASSDNPSRKPTIGVGVDAHGYPVYEKSPSETAADAAKEVAEKAEAERLSAEVAAAEKAAVDKVAADKAEADRVAAEAAAVAAAEAARKEQERSAVPSKRIVREYQVKDENGNPIGRPTHLEANSWEEMVEKQEQAHINAVRYAERLKRQKVATKAPEPVVVNTGMSEEELVKALQTVKEKNPQEAIEIVKKFIDVDSINKTIQEANAQTLKARQAAATYGFLQAHRDDYYNIEANAQMIKNYVDENHLDWTLDNLELAFVDLTSQLAPIPVSAVPEIAPASVVPAQVTAPPAANPPVVPPPAPAVVVSKIPTASEVAEQVLEKLIKDNPGLLDTRRGVNSGIQPGSMSGVRPASIPAARLTYDEVRKWTGDQMRMELRKPGRAAEIEAAIAERNASQ
jgi:hypothetical protein